MRKVFISYRHNAHKDIKDKLISLNDQFDLFIDKSVKLGDISNDLSDETIRQIIRDKKLKDSTITLFIHGSGTSKRKFIDWEIAGSMTNYNDSKQNAIIVINTEDYALSAHNTENTDVAIDVSNFVPVSKDDSKSNVYWRSVLPNAPERLIKNMTIESVCVNVIRWKDILKNPHLLKNLIDKVYEYRLKNDYDTSIPLKRSNG